MCNVQQSYKNMFQEILTIKSKPFSQVNKIQKLMTEIGGGWYIEKLLR